MFGGLLLGCCFAPPSCFFCSPWPSCEPPAPPMQPSTCGGMQRGNVPGSLLPQGQRHCGSSFLERKEANSYCLGLMAEHPPASLLAVAPRLCPQGLGGDRGLQAHEMEMGKRLKRQTCRSGGRCWVNPGRGVKEEPPDVASREKPRKNKKRVQGRRRTSLETIF